MRTTELPLMLCITLIIASCDAGTAPSDPLTSTPPPTVQVTPRKVSAIWTLQRVATSSSEITTPFLVVAGLFRMRLDTLGAFEAATQTSLGSGSYTLVSAGQIKPTIRRGEGFVHPTLYVTALTDSTISTYANAKDANDLVGLTNYFTQPVTFLFTASPYRNYSFVGTHTVVKIEDNVTTTTRDVTSAVICPTPNPTANPPTCTVNSMTFQFREAGTYRLNVDYTNLINAAPPAAGGRADVTFDNVKTTYVINQSAQTVTLQVAATATATALPVQAYYTVVTNNRITLTLPSAVMNSIMSTTVYQGSVRLTLERR